jgi:hypothetical protein
MVWLFALGIIWFCLISDGFRRLVFWLLGLLAVGAVVLGLVMLSGH